MLLDPDARARYDAALATGRPPPAPLPPASGSAATGLPGAARPSRPQRPPAEVPPLARTPTPPPRHGQPPRSPRRSATPGPPADAPPAATSPRRQHPAAAASRRGAEPAGPPPRLRPRRGASRRSPAPRAPAQDPCRRLTSPRASWTGSAAPASARAAGLAVAQVSERTKVSRYHIENIEAERFRPLPVAVYLRGIVMCLARELRLDGQKVARPTWSGGRRPRVGAQAGSAADPAEPGAASLTRPWDQG